MSCSICNGHPHCPCCEEEVKMEQCKECKGKGYRLCNECDEDVPATFKEGDEYACYGCECTITRIDCETCNGTGEVEVEPYDDSDDRYEEYRERKMSAQ